MTELLGLSYSPWTEKARWALDARKIAYTYRVYAPLIGEPALRRKTRKWSGPVTVPVLTADDGDVIADSADIARWADRSGEGPTLFPAEHREAIAQFVELSETGLDAGRGLALRRVLKDGEALLEMVPKQLRRLGGVARGVAAVGIQRTLRKYGTPLSSPSAPLEARLAAVLDAMRAALVGQTAEDGAPKTLLGSFTFADIAVTQVLTFVDPPSFGLRIAHASRRNFRDEAMCERYADLLTWRDAIYETYRPRMPGRTRAGA